MFSSRELVRTVRNDGTANLFQFGEMQLNGFAVAVPEPSTIIMSGAGGIALAGMAYHSIKRRRKRRRSSKKGVEPVAV